MLDWLGRFRAMINRSFERRLRRASGLDQPAPPSVAVPDPESEEDDGSEISNVALGVDLGTSTEVKPALADLSADLPPPPVIRPQPAPQSITSQEDEDEEEGTIINL